MYNVIIGTIINYCIDIQVLLQFARLAHIHTLTWAVMMAVFWCVSGSLLADLFNRFSDRVDLLSESPGEFDRRHRFNVFVVFSFLCMAGWVRMLLIANDVHEHYILGSYIRSSTCICINT